MTGVRSGSAIQYSFLGDHAGSIAEVTVDGAQVDSLDTYEVSCDAAVTCFVVTGSLAVQSGDHIVTIINKPLNASFPTLYFQSFA